MPLSTMWVTMARAIMMSFCGVLKTQRFFASMGSTMRAEAAIEIMGVPLSATASIIASELGVTVEPMMRSTLFSVMSLRVLATAVVVSEASSSTM